ncbi:MAG: SRPBCC family protein [Rhodobacter sp.]|nr:SRPBCC family protein [Rhodobacter sp.]
MRLTAKTDLEVPLGAVFANLVDHAAWEREAVQRGVEIERPADMPLTGVGAGWRIRVPFRGKVRKILLRIDDLVPDDRLAVGFDGQSVAGGSVLEVLELSARRTRLRVVLEVKPRTLAARLFLNTLRLAKGRVQARFETRVGQLGARIEDRHQRGKAQV